MKSLPLLALAAAAAAGEPVLIASPLSWWFPGYVVLPDNTVIYRDVQGALHSLDPLDPGSDTVIKPDWSPREHGWEFCGRDGMLRASPDGTMLLFTRNLRVPDSLQPEDYVPGPAGIFLCSPDGSNTRLVALSIEVGGGPEFQFTRDGARFYGSPILACPPTPQGMVDYWTGMFLDNSEPESPGYLVNIADGSRSGGDGDFLGDGFIPNPWSDLAACGAWPPDLIADASTGEVLLEMTLADGIFTPVIEQWVLPDAGLSRDPEGQILRYADGRIVRNPGPDISVHGRLADGRFLVSRGFDTPLMTARADWETFTVTPEDTLPGTSGLIGSMTPAVELPSGGAVLFRCEEGLYLVGLQP